MYIYPISQFSQVYSNRISNSVNNSQKQNTHFASDSFNKSLAFGNFPAIVTSIANKRFRNLNQLEHSFNNLMSDILLDTNIEKSPYFSYFAAGFKESGFSGLLGNLRMPKSTPKINALVEKSAEKELILAKLDGEPVLTLYNWGRHGFWQTDSSTRDMRILFSNAERIPDKEAIVEYTMNKKGQYCVSQRLGPEYFDTVYYPSTGNIRQETYYYSGGKSDTTYYNEDGSKAFFENWIYGGTRAEPIY